MADSIFLVRRSVLFGIIACQYLIKIPHRLISNLVGFFLLFILKLLTNTCSSIRLNRLLVLHCGRFALLNEFSIFCQNFSHFVCVYVVTLHSMEAFLQLLLHAARLQSGGVDQFWFEELISCILNSLVIRFCLFGRF